MCVLVKTEILLLHKMENSVYFLRFPHFYLDFKTVNNKPDTTNHAVSGFYIFIVNQKPDLSLLTLKSGIFYFLLLTNGTGVLSYSSSLLP
jgi:hypothetical protein